MSFLAIIEVPTFDLGNFYQFSCPKFTTIQISDSLKLQKWPFLYSNFAKIDLINVELSGK